MTDQERDIAITTIEIEITIAVQDGEYELALYLQEELNTIYRSRVI